MLENLVGYLIAREPEQLRAQYLEDVALCYAWFQSYQADPARQQNYAALPDRIGVWLREAEAPAIPTQGSRQQPLLRKLLDMLGEEHEQELTGDDLAFLCAVWDLIQRSRHREIYARPEECLKLHIAKIRKRLEDFAAEPGLPSIDLRMGIFTSDELRNATVREAKIFAGLDLNFRGPVLLRQGDTKIIGGIPEDCAVVAEEGACYVSGLVLGNLATTESCDILDNVSGVVVARRGDVRAGNIVHRATVISKEGSVFCRSSEHPKLVYGYQSIVVDGSAVSGQYYTKRFEAHGEVRGGEIHITEQAEAESFRQAEGRSLFIVFRRSINCRDYGEVLNAEASRMLMNVTRLSQRFSHVRHLQEIAEREADECAGNILLFLLGEDSGPEQAQQVERLRRRIAFIDRLYSGIRALILTVEDRLNMSHSVNHLDGEEPFSSSSEAIILEEMQRELNLLTSEGSIDRDLFMDREDVIQLGHRLQRKTLTQQQTLEHLKELHGKLDGLECKRADLMELVQKRETELKRAAERSNILQRAKERCSRVELLEQLLAAGRDRGGSEIFRRRTSDRFVKLMQRNIENRLSRVTEYRLNEKDIQSRLSQLRQKLWGEYMISLPENVIEEQGSEGAQVRGRFGAGVRLCAWRHLVENTQGGGPGILLTPDTMEQSVCYRRSSRGSIEVV